MFLVIASVPFDKKKIFLTFLTKSAENNMIGKLRCDECHNKENSETFIKN